MTPARLPLWVIALAIATLGHAGCRQLAAYAPSPAADVADAGWSEAGRSDAVNVPDDPPPPPLSSDLRPPYVVTADKVGQRLPLFREGQDTYRTVHSIYGSDTLGWWIVGEAGWIAHNPGDGYRRVLELEIKDKDYWAVWAQSATDVWISGNTNTTIGTQILHFAGGESFESKLAVDFMEPVTGIRGHGKTVWFSTEAKGQLLRWDGNRLEPVKTNRNEEHGRPWIDGNGLLYFATQGGVGTFNGNDWQQRQIDGALGNTSFRSIFGLSSNKLYLGGVDVLASRVDETAPQPFTAAGQTVGALWGRAADEVWAVGGPYVFRWDGAAWTTHWSDPSINTSTTRTFHDIAPCGALGTCVASSGGNLLRYHPAQQQQEPWRRIALSFNGYYRAVVSVGQVGAGGTLWLISSAAVLRERGWGVEVMPTAELGVANKTRELRNAHASAAGVLWVVGDQNLLARYDAQQRRFVVETGPAGSTTNLRSVRVIADGTIVIGAADNTLYWRKAGEGWQSMQVDAVPRALWDDGAGTVYWASVKGLTKYQLGGTVEQEQAGDFEAIHGHGSDLWAVGTGGKVWRRSTGGWAQVDDPSLGTINLHAVYVPPSGGVWIAGDGGKLWRSDAARKTLNLMATDTSRQLRSLHGSGAEDVWIGGDDILLHYPDGP